MTAGHPIWTPLSYDWISSFGVAERRFVTVPLHIALKFDLLRNCQCVIELDAEVTHE